MTIHPVKREKSYPSFKLLLHFKPVWFLADPIGNSHLGKTYILRLKLSNVRVSKHHLKRKKDVLSKSSEYLADKC